MKMKFVILLVLTVNVWAGSLVVESVPKVMYVSSALFSSLSNQGLDSAFLTCPNSNFKVWSLKTTFTSAGKVSPCISMFNTCLGAGNTTATTAIDTAIGDILYLGWNPSLKVYVPTEVTTSTRFDGTFIAQRYCVGKEFLK